MLQKITISYFSSGTLEGEQLYKKICSALTNTKNVNYLFEITKKKSTPMAAIRSYMCDDIVLFDASLDKHGTQEIGKQYDAMSEPFKSSQHVLIVSRTIIPFNVYCAKKGGYPHYITTGVSEYAETMSNQEISDWVTATIISGDITLPNPTKISKVYFDTHLKDALLKNKLEKMIVKNMNMVNKAKKKEEVFVSYISRYSKHFHSPIKHVSYFVEDLFPFIANYSNISIEQIGYFPPGTLSSELMTLQRKWEIVSVTDDFIRECKQFWIFLTDDYFQSWWTKSELITLSYILDSEPEVCPDICVARPQMKDGKLFIQVEQHLTIEDKRAFLPVTKGRIHQEMARFYVNSRPGTVGYECQTPMQLLHDSPRAVIAVMYLLSKIFQKKLLNSKKSEYGKIKFKDFYKSAKAYTYTKSFWKEWILECPICKRTQFQKWNSESFLYPFKEKFCHRINEGNLSYDQEKECYSFVCGTCRHSFHFKLGNYFRWWTIRSNQQTSPDGTSLEVINAMYFFSTNESGIVEDNDGK